MSMLRQKHWPLWTAFVLQIVRLLHFTSGLSVLHDTKKGCDTSEKNKYYIFNTVALRGSVSSWENT